MFLHRQGYSFFEEGKLINSEVDMLVGAWNDEQREKAREARKSKWKRR